MSPLVFSGLYIHTHVIQTEAFDCYIVVYKECVILEWDVKQHLIHQPKCYCVMKGIQFFIKQKQHVTTLNIVQLSRGNPG